mmetsp:Transcript_19281/g.21596  ORF Transcript_19281/g.21596 Transcript_19281/m.21596 type:complete len:176 (+) Transcript_19281:25-552(+)
MDKVNEQVIKDSEQQKTRQRGNSIESIENFDETIKKEFEGFWRRVYESKTRSCKHKRGCIYNVLHGAMKSFGLGFGAKFSVNLLLGLLKPKTLLSNLFSLDSILDTSRFTLFVVLFNISYKIVLCTLRRWTKNEKISSILAAMISASTIALEPFNRRFQIVLMLLTRSLETGYNW